MFVKAEIEGVANPSWVIPERALHGDTVYMFGQDNRLKMQSVSVIYRRDNTVVVEGDFDQGDKLILNDILPAIDGMLLREATLKNEEESSL